MCLDGALCARGLHSGAERSLRAQKRLPRNGRTVLDYIKGVAALRREKALSNPALAGLAVVAAAGVACLVLATFATLIEIRVGTTTNIPDQDTHLSGWDRHGPALLVPQESGRIRATPSVIGKPGHLRHAAQRRHGACSTNGSLNRKIFHQVLVLLDVCRFHQSREIRNEY